MPENSTIMGKVIHQVAGAASIQTGTAFTIGGSDLEPRKFLCRPRWIELNGALGNGNLTDTTLHGELADGRFVAVEVGATTPGAGGTPQHQVSTVRFFDYRPAGWGRAAWLYALANFTLGGAQRFGQLGVSEFKADGNASWHRDTTRFVFAGREWIVSDLLDPKQDKDLREFRNHWTPIASAELWTERRDGDDPAVLDLQARDIANLLSFATGHCVRWLDRVDIDATGKVTGRHKPSIWCAGAKEGGNGPLDVNDPDQFTRFMDRAGTAVAADQDWWARTLELHLQGMLSDIIDVRLTFFYVLMDRISSKVITTKFPPQIDPNLTGALDDQRWRADLHAVLSRLSPNWSEDRTKQLIATIKQWNAEPPFKTCVQIAATHLGLPEPDGRLITGRNPVVHDGDLPDRLPAGARHSGDLARAAEGLVTTMLLRMLGHEGDAYLPDAGRDHLPIHPWPTNRPCPWAIAASPTASTPH